MKSTATMFVIVAIVLSGCGPLVPIQTLDKTGVDILLAAAKLPVVPAESTKTMQPLGEVVGYSCMNKATEPSASKVGAIDQAKIVAIQRGARAITALECEEGGVSLISNCWHSWECKANAFR